MEQFEFDEEDFVKFLEQLISFSEKLQNNPPELVPEEDLPASAVCAALAPYTTSNGGPLLVRKCTYVEGRSNLILEYNPDKLDKVVSFVGSHFDVVPANPEEWSVDPFKLTRDGDKVSGRGVTDCLGHVAMITAFFKELGRHQPKLGMAVKALLIASEEASVIPDVGIDECQRRGELEAFRNGPLIWVDSANFGPTLGTASALQWQIDVQGKLFHSGLPHKAINTIELAGEVIKYVQKRFYADFSPGEKEKAYKFAIGSSLKPTQISVPKGGLNQIPGACTIQGDIRMTPFFDPKEVMARVESYIAELDVSTLESLGFSKFELPEENLKGTVTLKWLGVPFPGIACDLSSPGFKALDVAIKEVIGRDASFSLTGSLPLVGELKEAGFDVQVCGFGRMEAYHAVDEYGYISEFKKGFLVMRRVIELLSEKNA